MRPTVIHRDRLADFDRSLFGIDEVEEGSLTEIAERVAQKVLELHFR